MISEHVDSLLIFRDKVLYVWLKRVWAVEIIPCILTGHRYVYNVNERDVPALMILNNQKDVYYEYMCKAQF